VLDTHLKLPTTRRRLRRGPAALHVDAFADWLRSRGHPPSILRRKLQSFAAWTDWLRSTDRSCSDFLEGLEACEAFVKCRPKIPYQRGPNNDSVVAARLFIKFLRETGILPVKVPRQSASDLWPLIAEFRSWMTLHRGVTEATLNVYDPYLAELLATIGDQPAKFTAERLRSFVLARASRHGPSHAKLTATATRTFLRFLVATGRCQDGIEYSIPPFACWRYSSVPRYLRQEQIDQLLACCSGGGNGLRNKAILMLLARLGLRSGDVVRLNLTDFDWPNGTLVVKGKGRREELLPIPQDVGDAILLYLGQARPRIAEPVLFTTAKAPFRRMSTQAIAGIVRGTLSRAGIQAPTQGAHLLRHSAATNMLLQGASLASVGAVLRHHSPQTTVHYAKVDIRALSEIAQPWPGAVSC
jgi:integrase/recombinase XerD